MDAEVVPASGEHTSQNDCQEGVAGGPDLRLRELLLEEQQLQEVREAAVGQLDQFAGLGVGLRLNHELTHAEQRVHGLLREYSCGWSQGAEAGK